MRFAGTALLCIVAAFGAAFLIRRAVDHGGTQRGTVAADTRAGSPGPSPAATGQTEDTIAVHHRGAPQLASEFAPGVRTITRRRPKPKHHRHHVVSQSQGSGGPTGSGSSTEPTDTTSEPTDTTSAPTDSSPSAGSSGSGSSGATHHSAGSGTGTTSIGGSGRGSGTTTIG